jgi:hypothetical protein
MKEAIQQLSQEIRTLKNATNQQTRADDGAGNISESLNIPDFPLRTIEDVRRCNSSICNKRQEKQLVSN